MRRTLAILLWLAAAVSFIAAIYCVFRTDEKVQNIAKKVEFVPNAIIKIPSTFSRPLILDDEIFVACFDSKVLRISPVSAQITESFAFENVRFSSPICVSGESAFCACENGEAVAFNLKKGNVLWRKKFEEKSVGGFSALADSQKIFLAANDGKVRAINSNDGEILWTFDCEEPVNSAVALAQNSVVFGNCGGYLFSLDCESGKEKWRQNLGASIPNSPVIFDGKIFVSTYSGGLFCLDFDSGKILWKRDFNAPVFAQIEVENGKILVCDTDDSVRILDAQTGDELLSKKFDATLKAAIFWDDKIVVFENLGAANFLNLQDMEIENRYEFRIRYSSSVASKEMLCVADFDDNLYIFKKGLRNE